MTGPGPSTRPRPWRIAQALLALAVVALAVRTLARHWSEFVAQPVQWQISPIWLGASALIVWLCYALLVEAWRRVVISMDQRLDYASAARICMLSNLGKYVPGKVWAIAGTAFLSRQAGVEPAAAVTSAVLLQALAVASGVALVAFVAPATLSGMSPAFRVATAAVGGAAILGVAALSWPPAARALQRLVPIPGLRLRAVPPAVMAVGLGANALAWAGYAIAFQCLLRGLAPAATLRWADAAAVFTTSYLVGLVAVFAPGGIGPRESLFVLLLQGPLGLKLATAMALASRLLLTVTELGAAAPFLIRKGASR